MVRWICRSVFRFVLLVSVGGCTASDGGSVSNGTEDVSGGDSDAGGGDVEVDSGGDGGSECEQTQRGCPGACIDPPRDLQTCGACDDTCSGGSCIGGICTSTCTGRISYDLNSIYPAIGPMHDWTDLDADGDLDLVSATDETLQFVFLQDSRVQSVQTVTSVDDVEWLVSGDFDGDGDRDVFAASSTDTAFHANDAGQFSDVTPSSAQVSHVGTGDFDGDGTMDLLRANFSAANVYFGGDSGPGDAVQVADFIDHARALDVNGDGIDEVVVADGSDISIFESDGSRGFSEMATTTVSTGADLLHVGDFDGDGHDDLIGADSLGSFDASLYLFTGNSDGSLDAGVDLGIQPRFRFLTVGDADGDGRDDLVAATEEGLVTLFRGNSTGLEPPIRLSTSGELADGLSIVDVDGDDHADLSVYRSSGIVALRGSGGGRFGLDIAEPHAEFGVRVALSDLDADGDEDAVLWDAGAGICTSIFDQGAFSARECRSLDAEHIVPADVDTDGAVDLLVYYATELGWLPGQGDGTFGSLQSLHTFPSNVDDIDIVDEGADRLLVARSGGSGRVFAFPDATMGEEVLQVEVGSYGDVAAGDIDGDGAVDLFFQNSDTDMLEIHYRTPDGFETGPTLESNQGVDAVADLDGDGHRDVVTSNFVAWGPVGSLERDVRFGVHQTSVLGTIDADEDGDAEVVTSGPSVGVFDFDGDRNPRVLSVDHVPGARVLSDVDGDGRADVVALDNELTVHLGSDEGRFGDRPLIATGGNPLDVSAADVNADGQHDLFVSFLNLGLSVHWSQDGGYAAQRWLVSGSSADPVVNPTVARLVDFNVDGYLDVVVTGSNAGGGAYDAQTRLLAWDPVGAELADPVDVGGVGYRTVFGHADDDGWLDYALLSRVQGERRIYLGQPPGNAVAEGPELPSHIGLTGGDLDGDGRLELVQTDGAGGWIVIDVQTDGTLSEQPLEVNSQSSILSNLSTADVDGDGADDLIGVRQSNDIGPGRLFVLSGGPDLELIDDGADIVTGHDVYQIIPTDLDGDGHVDLLAVGPGVTTLILGSDTGLGTPVSYEGAFSATADVNGDGLLDLVDPVRLGLRTMEAICE